MFFQQGCKVLTDLRPDIQERDHNAEHSQEAKGRLQGSNREMMHFFSLCHCGLTFAPLWELRARLSRGKEGPAGGSGVPPHREGPSSDQHHDLTSPVPAGAEGLGRRSRPHPARSRAAHWPHSCHSTPLPPAHNGSSRPDWPPLDLRRPRRSRPLAHLNRLRQNGAAAGDRGAPGRHQRRGPGLAQPSAPRPPRARHQKPPAHCCHRPSLSGPGRVSRLSRDSSGGWEAVPRTRGRDFPAQPSVVRERPVVPAGVGVIVVTRN